MTETLTTRQPRYVAADETSLLMSDRACAIADFIIARGNARSAKGQDRGSFSERYFEITSLARRRYPLPRSTGHTFRTDSPAHFLEKR